MLMRSLPLVRDPRRPPGFIVPCQPTVAEKPPIGPQWTHELKHDGIRVIARREGDDVRIWSRTGRPWTRDLPRIAAAVRALPVTSIVFDGEAICDGYYGGTDFGALLSPGGCEEGALLHGERGDERHVGRDGRDGQPAEKLLQGPHAPPPFVDGSSRLNRGA
jgi:hypothetical protein